MICRFCNSNIREGVRFCPMCGNDLSVRVCPRCGTGMPGNACFCPVCGLKTGCTCCRACGSMVTEEARFCPVCGTAMMPTPFIQQAASVQQPFIQQAADVPAPAAGQEPSSHVKKPRAGLSALWIVLIAIAVIAIAFSAYLIFRQRTVTAEENNALWGKANNAIAAFVADDPTLFESPITPEKTDKAARLISEFDRALKDLEAVKPPSDQTIVHEMFLPLYRGIFDQMVIVKDAMAAGDDLKTDLEVQRLRLLLEELGAASDILTY